MYVLEERKRGKPQSPLLWMGQPLKSAPVILRRRSTRYPGLLGTVVWCNFVPAPIKAEIRKVVAALKVLAGRDCRISSSPQGLHRVTSSHPLGVRHAIYKFGSARKCCVYAGYFENEPERDNPLAANNRRD